MTQNEYDKWYRELNETQKEVTDEFLAWKEKASKWSTFIRKFIQIVH